MSGSIKGDSGSADDQTQEVQRGGGDSAESSLRRAKRRETGVT
jgi:hypothetical protein